jgi:hypothetical protein
MAGGGVPIYTEICAELGAAIAAASSTPAIQVHLILSLLGKYLLKSDSPDALGALLPFF